MSVGTATVSGLSTMSSNCVTLVSNATKVIMSRAALSPNVPANSASLVSLERLLLMIGSDFSNERGDTKDNCGLVGLKIYGLSPWSESLYDLSIRGNICTPARITGLMPRSPAQLSHNAGLGFSICTRVSRLAVCAGRTSPIPSVMLLDVANTIEPSGRGSSPTVRSRYMRV